MFETGEKEGKMLSFLTKKVVLFTAASKVCRLRAYSNVCSAADLQDAPYFFAQTLLTIFVGTLRCATRGCLHGNTTSDTLAQVDSAFYPPWDGKLGTIQRAVMLCGWEDNRRPGGK